MVKTLWKLGNPLIKDPNLFCKSKVNRELELFMASWGRVRGKLIIFLFHVILRQIRSSAHRIFLNFYSKYQNKRYITFIMVKKFRLENFGKRFTAKISCKMTECHFLFIFGLDKINCSTNLTLICIIKTKRCR